jgi:hypothetical protein
MLRILPVLLLLSACGAGTAGGTADAAGDDDCADPAGALPAGWVPIDTVSAGAVASTGSGPTSTLIDASAGGFGNSDDEPFVYVQFSGTTASKVDISDVDAFASSGWHLAIKRYVIKINSGDSGPGDVEVAVADGATLAAVTTVPAAGSFGEDDWANAACDVLLDGLGAPLTAMGNWYEAADGMLTPLDLIFVLRLPGGEHIKVDIVDYYANPADSTQSAYFQLDWQAL